ncbi:5896_t:CDS:1, partial [Dentiscutata erythropus]
KNLMQISTKATDIDMDDELTIKNLFDVQMFKQSQEETIERSSILYSQTPTITNEDWSIDDIFSEF